MLKWIAVGTVLQTAMVVAGHWIAAVARLFGPLGVAISLMVGLLWARGSAEGWREGAGGGALVGGACALVGIALSLALGDVTPAVLVFGTVSSAMTGAIGGAAGHRLGGSAAAGAAR